jgi:drug/metabolite transporter (DMT)-like permease
LQAYDTIACVSFTWGVVTLLSLTLIWGSSFAVTKDTLLAISPALLLALRATLSALSLIWVRPDNRSFRPGLILGVVTFLGLACQTIGLSTTSASKSAFIIALNSVVAPLVSAWVFKHNIPARVFAALGVAVLGLGLMTLVGQQEINTGDLWTLGGALCYGFYIAYLGEVARLGSARFMILIQSLVMAVIGWIWAIPKVYQLPGLSVSTWLSIFYLGIVCMVIPAVLQVYAQRVVRPYVAALLFVLEPVFAAIFAFFLLGERLSVLDWSGAGLVVTALLLASLPKTLKKVSAAKKF